MSCGMHALFCIGKKRICPCFILIPVVFELQTFDMAVIKMLLLFAIVSEMQLEMAHFLRESVVPNVSAEFVRYVSYLG